jgi:outer membrane protein TolC
MKGTTNRSGRINARSVGAVPALLLAACIRYQPLPVSLPANAESLRTRSLDAQSVRRLVGEHHPEAAATWPPSLWTPDMLTLAAIALHPDLDVARAEWASARAALRTAAERPNPAATIGLERKSGSAEVSPWITTLGFEVPLETAGKRGARIAQAEALSIAAAADVDQAVWNIRTRAANALVDLSAARELVRFRHAELKLREEIIAMLDRRVEVGETAQPELARVRADARTSRLLLRDEEGRAAEREAALAAAIGIPRDALPPLDLSPSAASPQPIDVGALRMIAMTARPDVLAALARYEAAEEALRLEVRRQYPDIRVGPGLGWDQGAFKWALSATAELPILNQHRGLIAEAHARREVAGAQLLALQAKILGDLDTALATQGSARARLAEAEQLLAERRALSAAIRRQFEAGEIDRLTLRTLEVEATLADLDRVTAFYALKRAQVAIEAAVEQAR